MQQKTVVVAGATGDLGERVVRALINKGARVRAILRGTTSSASRQRLAAFGVALVDSDYDAQSLKVGCEGASCVVAALNGLEDVILGQQSALLKAAIAAGVPRFIPSDFSLDYTKTIPGENRNMDLRRRFGIQLDAAPIQASSVLNGAFSTVLTEDAPIVLPKIRRILHWGDADQTLNFTTKDDVAAFTADAALDDEAPRYLRIAGGSVSPHQLAALASEMSGKTYRTMRAGGLQRLGLVIRMTRTLAPSPGMIFPPWQGMQYLRDMMSGRGELLPLDNSRYGKTDWTDVRTMIAGIV